MRHPPIFGENGNRALEDEAAGADRFECGVRNAERGIRRNALWRAQPVEDRLVGSGAPGDDELVVNRVNRERVGKAGNGRPGRRRGEAESGLERKGQRFDIPAQFHVIAGPGNEQLWPGGKIAGLHLESAYVAGIAGRSGQIQNILWPRQVTLIACESAVAGVNGRAAGQ